MTVVKKITIRKATSQDANGIVKVLKSTRLGTETWTANEKLVRKALNEFLELENCTLLLAECNGQVIGFVDYYVFPSFWEGTRQGIINDLFVIPSFQHQSVGKKLLKTIIEQADAERLGELHVSTEPENVAARRLYAKHGFTEERLLLERASECT